MLAARPLLVADEPAARIAAFKEHFGADLDELETAFYRHLDRVK
jgi:hypothetical protein